MTEHEEEARTPQHCGTIRSQPIGSCGCKRPLLVVLAIIALLLVISALTGGESATPEAEGATPQNSARGFDLSNAVIPREQIVRGGPGKDGIPAITEPKFITAGQNRREVRPADRVIGVRIGDEARAYPLAILNRHECVNDVVDDLPIAVTYCPLCDSAAVFDRRIAGETLTFGISGLLYNSNVLLYDRSEKRAESLWSQVRMSAVAGPLAGTRLRTVPAELTQWAAWSRENPDTVVLSRDTGHRFNYDRNPYRRYFDDRDALMFSVDPLDKRRALKDRVLGVCIDDACHAYAQRDLVGRPRIMDRIAGNPVTVTYDHATGTIRAAELPDDASMVYSFWFAWAAIHPDTGVYEAKLPGASADLAVK